MGSPKMSQITTTVWTNQQVSIFSAIVQWVYLVNFTIMTVWIEAFVVTQNLTWKCASKKVGKQHSTN